ncbi:MAG TPA: hypothetical protein VIT20_03560 [Propionibacteriaceae bacterium]
MRARSRIAHVVMIVLGLLVLTYPWTFGAASAVSCRGAVMQPGDTCSKADNSGVQTYEQRAADRANATPVIVVVGLLVSGFGTSLLVTDVRRSRRTLDPA